MYYRAGEVRSICSCWVEYHPHRLQSVLSGSLLELYSKLVTTPPSPTVQYNTYWSARQRVVLMRKRVVAWRSRGRGAMFIPLDRTPGVGREDNALLLE